MREEIIDMHAHLPPDPGHLPEMAAAFRKNGVSKVLFSSLGRGEWPRFPDDSQVARANADTFHACRENSGFYGFVYLNPNGRWRPEVEKWRDDRFFVGVKLWVSLRDEAGDCRVCLPVLEYAAREGFPVLMHSFFHAGRKLPGELTPAEISFLAGRVPEASIIMAHLGGTFEKGVSAVAGRPNVSADISGSSPSRGMVEAAVRALGPERVLFGADMPCRTVQGQLAKVLFSSLSPAARRRVLAGNALSLFDFRS